MIKKSLIRDCRRCGEKCAPNAVRADGIRRRRSRGLCYECFRLSEEDDTLYDYPKEIRSRDEFLEEYRILHARGLTIQEIADKMGLSVDAIYVNRVRARRAGVDI